MAETKLPPKVYVKGTIGNTKAVYAALTEYGAKNPSDYKFGDPSSIYYIDKHSNIQKCTIDSELYYFITNSDWEELKPIKSKKIRKYILTIKEGSPSCEGCEFGKKCPQEQREKCELGKLLSSVTNGPQMAGKTLLIEDITGEQEPPTPLKPEDL